MSRTSLQIVLIEDYTFEYLDDELNDDYIIFRRGTIGTLEGELIRIEEFQFPEIYIAGKYSVPITQGKSIEGFYALLKSKLIGRSINGLINGCILEGELEEIYEEFKRNTSI
jgi:hypothetical protein